MRAIGLAAGWVALPFVALVGSRAAEPLPVRATIESGPHYAGQAIGLTVQVVAEADRPTVDEPRVSGARVFAGRVDSRPISTSAIGQVVHETRSYRYRFWVVPAHAGTLRIPPIKARAGEREGTAPARSLDIRELPQAGRTRAFVGGVGPLRLSASAEPTRLRVGQELEYRLTLEGPAALGSARRPELAGLERAGLKPTGEAFADEVAADPPARVVRWRLRALKAGEVKVPPVRVAHFDPETGAYLTELAPAVPIAVLDVPTLDPSRLDYAAPGAHEENWAYRLAPIAAGVVLALSLLLVQWVRRRARERRGADPRRLARRLAAGITAGGDPDESARRIVEALAEFLWRIARRPTGALTPIEARRGFERLTGDADLARRAGRLVSDCDRARFAGRPPGATDLAGEARGFFEGLAGASFAAAETPGEAPGAAKDEGGRDECLSEPTPKPSTSDNRLDHSH